VARHSWKAAPHLPRGLRPDVRGPQAGHDTSKTVPQVQVGFLGAVVVVIEDMAKQIALRRLDVNSWRLMDCVTTSGHLEK
jgi:hypothetical protein